MAYGRALGRIPDRDREGLDQLDVELVRFEQEPNNAEMLNTIFRLVHTLKGTCGFLGLGRLAKLEHAAEMLMANIATAPRLRLTASASSSRASTASSKILEGLERDGVEPQGSDADLIGSLQGLACHPMPGIHEISVVQKRRWPGRARP